jgi:hypothetical protein
MRCVGRPTVSVPLTLIEPVRAPIRPMIARRRAGAAGAVPAEQGDDLALVDVKSTPCSTCDSPYQPWTPWTSRKARGHQCAPASSVWALPM